VVHDENFMSVITGPEIVIESTVTGGAPYRYSEVDKVME
jgi:hypothetical protein